MRPRGPVRGLPVAGVVAALASACLLAACEGSPTQPVTSPTSVPGVTSATPSVSPSPSPSAEPKGQKVTLVATGDVLVHDPIRDQAEQDAELKGSAGMDFSPMLAAVRPIVSTADVGLCHLETPLAPAKGPFRAYPSFSAPPQVVPALKATGYDVCSTASNHTFDQGAAGIDRTLDDLDAAGIEHAGSARSRAESRKITMLTTGSGVRVAVLSYAYGWNGYGYPGGNTWRANVIDTGRILADAHRARGAGAQIVVLALHWGTEYQHRPSAQQLQVAPKLARSQDIDLIISHHSHVVEPIQKIGRVWVVYGLGNLLAWHSTPGPDNAEGLLVRFTFTRGDAGRYQITRAEYDPLLVARQAPIRVLDIRSALARHRYGSSTRERLDQALRRTTGVVTSMKGRSDGLVPLQR